MKPQTDKDRINQVFIDWFESRLIGTEFKLPDLINHARNRTTLYYRLDDSFRRYLGQLREAGLINYECVNRSKSLYKSINKTI